MTDSKIAAWNFFPEQYLGWLTIILLVGGSILILYALYYITIHPIENKKLVRKK
jgi:hypothetical protein